MITMALACIVLHNVCFDRGDLIPTKYDITLNPISNKRRSSQEISDLLDMTDKSCNTWNLLSNAIKESFGAKNNLRYIFILFDISLIFLNALYLVLLVCI